MAEEQKLSLPHNEAEDEWYAVDEETAQTFAKQNKWDTETKPGKRAVIERRGTSYVVRKPDTASEPSGDAGPVNESRSTGPGEKRSTAKRSTAKRSTTPAQPDSRAAGTPNS
jgi:hypothetical protein